MEEKNFIADQQISLEQAADIVARTKGGDASSSSHHFLSAVEVWVFKPVSKAVRWYVKGYLLEGELHIIELHLISFHPSER